MATVEHNGKLFEVDEEGFLINGLKDWNVSWVYLVAGFEGMQEIVDDHWGAIYFLQKYYYMQNRIVPLPTVLCRCLGISFTSICKLFPPVSYIVAAKMAGIPSVAFKTTFNMK